MLPNSALILSKVSLPGGRTLSYALGTLGAVTLLQLLLAARGLHQIAERREVSARTASSPKNEGPTLIIEPRLAAPIIRAPWQDLLEQSRAAAAMGDNPGAIAVLQEAEQQLPEQPSAIAELAVQFEKLGSTDRALQLWDKVYQFGSSAGVYFAAAEAKLSLLRNPGAFRTQPSAVTQPAPQATPKPGALRLTKLPVKDAADSTPTRRHFTLNIPIQRAPETTILARDVSISVQFYDQINGHNLERTNASVSWKWLSGSPSWKGKTAEVLQAEYIQPAKTSKEDRRFFGYVASVYYRDKLVDTHSEPPRLGQQYPPPRMLPKESAP